MHIRNITKQDQAYFLEAIELLNRTQGRDLCGPNFLLDLMDQDDAVVVAAFEDKNLIGIAVAKIIDNFDYYVPFNPQINEDFKNLKVGSFATMSVVESMQGRGVGQALSRKRLEWLRAKGCNVVVGVSWVSGLTHTSNRAFEKLGFRPVKWVEKFYGPSSIENPFVCPGCGEPPCECAAVLYTLNL